MGVDLMRILPATGLFNAFAALHNLNGKYQRSIESLPVENPDEVDESDMMQEFLPNNENFEVYFLPSESSQLVTFPIISSGWRTLLKIHPRQRKETLLPGLRLGKRMQSLGVEKRRMRSQRVGRRGGMPNLRLGKRLSSDPFD